MLQMMRTRRTKFASMTAPGEMGLRLCDATSQPTWQGRR